MAATEAAPAPASNRDAVDAALVVDRARIMAAPVPTGGGLKSAIARISTEYRLQFAWPKEAAAERGRGAAGGQPQTQPQPPRKSLSMGAIKPAAAAAQAIAAVHKRRIADADGAELEPLVGWSDSQDEDGQGQGGGGGEEKIREETLGKEEKSQSAVSRAEFHSEYKKKFRPFSQYDYDYQEGRFKSRRQEPEPEPEDSWYREVLELRKKAGEYKHRGWGTELVPQHIAELYNKQMTLWEQVSRRSSLSALSLASTAPRSISKEEKEKENNKKSSPTKPPWSRQSPSRHISPQKKVEKSEDNKKESGRSRKETVVRHHLERTTGAADGALLQSPTREKLEPVLPRRKEDISEPVCKSVPKSSHSVSGAGSGRSQSVGPSTTFSSSESRSPKRSARTAKMTPPTEKRNRPKEATADVEAEAETAEVERQVEPEPEPEPEPVVKSPPEPTRVKSPEQILMRSPEPVNWTVPLDTGKTFTVTQNVHPGDLITRPHSEAKAWTPPVAPPAAQVSAPPQLAESRGESSAEAYDERPQSGREGRRAPSPPSPPLAAAATGSVDEARSRFERFWGAESDPGDKQRLASTTLDG